ncbi:MAG: hypothetical protein J2P27_00320 [Actinobacteria bacterium]|nr:hypothetical protein [Actinomycetota bacterium]
MSVLLADKSALEWARRDHRAQVAYLDLRTMHVIAACHMTALEVCYSARNRADLEALLAGQRALEWLPVSEVRWTPLWRSRVYLQPIAGTDTTGRSADPGPDHRSDGRTERRRGTPRRRRLRDDLRGDGSADAKVV